MPNQRMKIGRNAIFGEGNASAITGSNSQCRKRLRAMAIPSGTPTAVAKQSPTVFAYILTMLGVGLLLDFIMLKIQAAFPAWSTAT